MGYNFPDTPAPGEAFTPPGGPTWRYVDGVWQMATGGGTPLAGTVGFETVLAATNADIDVGVNSFQLAGYFSAGDGGGALYKRMGSMPTHIGRIQSADGAWWELAETVIDLRMLGGGTGNPSGDTAAFQGAIDMLDGGGKGSLQLPPGNITINQTLDIVRGRFNIVGYGKEVSVVNSAVIGAPLLRCTDGVVYMRIADFSCQGNLLTGASGNGHCFAFWGPANLSLAYDAQTANFTVLQKVTGATSGATGYINSDTDTVTPGVTGTLTLRRFTGTFVDNEIITDPLGGSATVNDPAPTGVLTGASSTPQAITFHDISVDGFRGNDQEGAVNDTDNVMVACAFNLKRALGCVIRDVSVQDCGGGVYAGQTQNCLIDNVTATDCDAFGILDVRAAALRINGGDIQKCCNNGTAVLVEGVTNLPCANIISYFGSGTIISGTKTKNAAANAQFYVEQAMGVVIEKAWIQTTMTADVLHKGILAHQCTNIMVRDCLISMTLSGFPLQKHTGIEFTTGQNAPFGGYIIANQVQFAGSVPIRAGIALTGAAAARVFSSISIENNVIGTRAASVTPAVAIDDGIVATTCTLRECRIANNVIQAQTNVIFTRGITLSGVINGGRNKIQDNTLVVTGSGGVGVSNIVTPYSGVSLDYTVSTSTTPFTLTPGVTGRYVKHTGALGGNVTVTLALGGVAGDTFRITRTGTGAFNLDIGGLKNLVTNTWCEVTFDGTAWFLASYGAL